MALQASFQKKIFQFNFKARTSRGIMRDKTSWFIKVWDDAAPQITGIGECGPLPGLSIDDRPDFEQVLEQTLKKVNGLQSLHVSSLHNLMPPGFPSLTFGLETALLDLENGGKRIIFTNEFIKGAPISINGLIWMGDLDFMLHQIGDKVSQGFNCIKLKVGGLNFDKECDVLEYIRKRYFREQLTIRLDANGGFKTDEVLFKLTELAKFKIHSIEQPIKAGLPEMEELCRKSPIPIAFDEELINIEGDAKKDLLTRLKPAYIILKPTLHGGISGCREWIAIAEKAGIGWWITSALESSIGLNAICQFTASYPLSIPQGLGTGSIYENNIPSPLKVKNGTILYDASQAWDLSELE
ncbi:o-succinylbenzoate synthase [Ohtaekwangia koreensis]|uniref:O-succinylbenzoate synthase n=1 Tax=Ohtaekwangia koreensis TaxID=688867 RepID=A0A1T5MFJ3_9BACT|nr:o-succinylbenzoate synthase [Ohtaekwangia koreensis]SKC86987.1 o-succinylbenzoate synthase [Ohtaekwangia koreensis]